MGSDQFPHIGSWDGAASMRKMLQAITVRAQGRRDPYRRFWIEISEIIVCAVGVVQGRPGPNNPHRSGARRGLSYAEGQFREPFTNPFMWHDASSSDVRFRFGIQTRRQGFILGFEIEIGLNFRVVHESSPSPANA
jgi:hypothetical protein